MILLVCKNIKLKFKVCKFQCCGTQKIGWVIWSWLGWDTVWLATVTGYNTKIMKIFGVKLSTNRKKAGRKPLNKVYASRYRVIWRYYLRRLRLLWPFMELKYCAYRNIGILESSLQCLIRFNMAVIRNYKDVQRHFLWHDSPSNKTLLDTLWNFILQNTGYNWTFDNWIKKINQDWIDRLIWFH